jgi:hypothetical protein
LNRLVIAVLWLASAGHGRGVSVALPGLSVASAHFC